MANHTLYKDFKQTNLAKTRVILVEASSRILGDFPEGLSEKAKGYLDKMGVEVRLNEMAKDLKNDSIQIGNELVHSTRLIWAAGVTPSSLSKKLQTETNSLGQVVVNEFLNLKDDASVYVIGDQAATFDKNGKPLPGVAPVAIQQGDYVGTRIARLNREQKPEEPSNTLIKELWPQWDAVRPLSQALECSSQAFSPGSFGFSFTLFI